jgi:hypothetical protein
VSKCQNLVSNSQQKNSTDIEKTNGQVARAGIRMDNKCNIKLRIGRR